MKPASNPAASAHRSRSKQGYVEIPVPLPAIQKGVKLINTGNVLIQAKLKYGITHNHDLSGMGEFTPIENLIEIQPGEEKDITNNVSPARGEAIADNKKVLYSGYTEVSLDPIKNPGVVTTKTYIEFISN